MPPVSHVKYAFLAAIAASTTLSSSVFAQRPKNPPPDDCPNDNPECKCPTDDAVENGCVLISLDLGRTTPWTGSDSVKLKIRTTKASPSLSTPSQLKLVLGYSFMYVGSDLTAAGAPRFVFFAQSAGRTLSFQFADGSSVGIPSPGMYGESKTRLQMVDAEGWATLSNPAFYDLYPGDGSVYRFSASPAAPDFGNLVHRIDPRGVLSTWEDMGVTVLRDAAGNIRQVSTRTRLADVQTLSDTHYSVTVYPLDAEPETDPDTGLLVPPQWNPTRVLDVSQGTSPLELLVGFQKGTGDIRQYRYVEQNGEWTLVKPSGLVDSKEIFYSADEMGARRLHLIRSPEGELLRRTEMNFASTPWGWAMTNRIEGIPGDATRTTSWSFYEEGPNRGEIREKITPTGNRILYEYDDKNRVVRESMPLVEEETLYSYEPVDPSDPPLLCDTRPRCVVRKMQGIEIQRTYYVYGTNGVDVVERVGEQGAAYGGTNVLRTVTTYYPVTGAITDGLVQSVRHEDGTIDNYAYDLANGIWTETVTHVHEQAPDIVPMRTTRSVRVYNAIGQLVDLRTDLCTIGVEDLIPQADWTPIERMQYAYDIEGNEIRREDLAGRLWTSEWAGNCCGKVSETDWQGVTTTYAYDEEGRVVSRQTGSVLVETAYDALGRVTNVVRTGVASAGRPAAVAHPSSWAYDSLGRTLRSEGEDGIRRVYSYACRPEGGEVRAVTEAPDTGCERVTATVTDPAGRTIRELRDGVLRRTVVRAPLLETTYEGSKGTNSPVWRAVASDAFGRTASEFVPGFGGSVLETARAYDGSGRLLSAEERTLPEAFPPRALRTPRENQTPRTRTLYAYDAIGALRVSGRDVDLSGTIDLAGPDMVVSNAVGYVARDGSLWRESSRFAFPETGSDEPLRVSATRGRLTGLGVAEATELGAATLVADTQTVDAFGNVASQRSFVDRASRRVATFNDSAASALSAWSLSVGGLAVSNRTETGVITSQSHDALGRVIAVTDGRGNATTLVYDAFGRLASSADAAGAMTSFGYDALGRRIRETDALGNERTTACDADDNVVSRRGAQYPVDFAYDEYGRMSAMTTHRTEDLAVGDVTTWLRDEATGLVTNKVYADGMGPAYGYTPDGRLSRRTWARGVTTDYAYDEQGRLISKTYSDATPNVSLSYDRLGHTLSAVCAGVSTNFYTYNRLGQLTNEVQNGTTIARTYDVLGRPTGYVIGDGVASGSMASYSYDALGRFASVSSGTNVFSYSYLPGSSLVSGMTANTGHAWERIYETDRDLIATVHNRYGARTISRFDYTNDEIGRRITRVDSGEAFSESAFELYSYNDRSEVVGSQRFFGSDLSDRSRLVPNRSFGYSYDPIGNRLSSTEDADGTPVFTLYESNELNQYVQTSNAVSSTAFEYDADGNMTFDGRFLYSWNGENRMIRAEETSVPTNCAPTTIIYAYDEQGRMVSKNITGTNTVARSLLWDGYNIVRETDNGATTYNIWGVDLDGTLQGAGGVGGLLLTVSENAFFCPLFDANGNISEYIDSQGRISFHREYDGFGVARDQNQTEGRHPISYSTKQNDFFLGVCEYEFRHYSPSLGQWLSRDPLIEFFPVLPYQFCNNNPLSDFDYLGLDSADGECEKYCGPDVSNELANELNDAVDKWAKDYGKYTESIIDFVYYRMVVRWEAMLKIGPKLDRLAVKYAIPAANGIACPSGVECERTYMICGECVHDHFIGNILYGYWMKLFGFREITALGAGHLYQLVGQSDDGSYDGAYRLDWPYDQAGYELGWALFDSGQFGLDGSSVCNLIKNLDAFKKANETGKDYTQCKKCPISR